MTHSKFTFSPQFNMACTRQSTLQTSTRMFKDFTPIAKLPLRPLRMSHLLGRYAFIKG